MEEDSRNQADLEKYIDNHNPSIIRRIERGSNLGMVAGGLLGFSLSLGIHQYIMYLSNRSYESPALYVVGLLAGGALGSIFFRNNAVKKEIKNNPAISDEIRAWSEISEKIFND